jgi:hypothetical protein
MTKSQVEQLRQAIKGWERVKAKITIIGEDDKKNIICQLETNAFTQKFIIGKRGAITWLYKYNKY